MKELPLMQIFTSDELATTHLLNPFELGCVWKLRLQLWEENCKGLNNDDYYLSRICFTTLTKFRKAKPNFFHLFEEKNNLIFYIEDLYRWYQAEAKSSQNSNNSKARWNKERNLKDANAIQSESQLELEPELEPKPQLESNRDIDRLPKDEWNKNILIFKEIKKGLVPPRIKIPKAVQQYNLLLSSGLVDKTPDELRDIYNQQATEINDHKYMPEFSNWLADMGWENSTKFNPVVEYDPPSRFS